MAADCDGGKGGGGGVSGGLNQESGQASFEQVFWRSARNTGVILTA